ncbi:hypothetical protein F652_1355 [Enterobacteriaceae bacterium bta3-1]|nr:hypothetical protein F652_1355 [Enterobacteriaceae bacterium bta3-1]
MRFEQKPSGRLSVRFFISRMNEVRTAFADCKLRKNLP